MCSLGHAYLTNSKVQSPSGSENVLLLKHITISFIMVMHLFDNYKPSQECVLFLHSHVNCAILGSSLFMQERAYANITEATVFGLGSGSGFFLAIVGLAAIREKIRYSNVPGPLRGLGITYIITGLMGIAFMSFMGIKL